MTNEISSIKKDSFWIFCCIKYSITNHKKLRSVTLLYKLELNKKRNQADDCMDMHKRMWRKNAERTHMIKGMQNSKTAKQ